MVPSIQQRMRRTFFLPYDRWMFSALVFKDRIAYDIFCNDLLTRPWR